MTIFDNMTEALGNVNATSGSWPKSSHLVSVGLGCREETPIGYQKPENSCYTAAAKAQSETSTAILTLEGGLESVDSVVIASIQWISQNTIEAGA